MKNIMIEKRLTITMPVFERKEYFLDALNSALNQTVRCDILVIDNSSSHDYFKDVCLEKGVNYIKNDSNIGLFPNWNKCMNTAETDYAMILQDDCTLELNFVESFQKVLNKYPDLEFYYTDFSKMDLATMIKSDHIHSFPFGYYEDGMKVIEFAAEYNMGLLYSFIVKRSKFSEYYYLFHGSNDWLWIYSNIEHFVIYGDAKKLVNYGSNEFQDSKNPNTHIHVMLTLSYIYENIISTNSRLKKSLVLKSKKNATSAFFYFLSITTKIKLAEIISMQQENIYSEYLKQKCSKNIVLSTFVKSPLIFRKLVFKVFTKFGIVDLF